MIIFALCLAGVWIADFLPIALPANVIAMLLLFILLVFRAVKPVHIETTADFLLKNMAFFFLPATVGVMEHFDLLKSSLLPLLVICTFTTLLTFLATAYTVKGVTALQNRLEKAKERVVLTGKEEAKCRN